MSKPFIFGIGLSRTGTTSLAEALRILGYNSCHWPRSIEELESHEAVCDITVSCRFGELDRKFPASKFIYTFRDISSWLKSCVAHYDYLRRHRDSLALPAFCVEAEMDLFGTLEFDERKFIAAYQRHHESIMSYFANRREVLLVLDIVGGDGWETLCNFLVRPVPSVRFPCEHSGSRPPWQ